MSSWMSIGFSLEILGERDSIEFHCFLILGMRINGVQEFPLKAET